MDDLITVVVIVIIVISTIAGKFKELKKKGEWGGQPEAPKDELQERLERMLRGDFDVTQPPPSSAPQRPSAPAQGPAPIFEPTRPPVVVVEERPRPSAPAPAPMARRMEPAPAVPPREAAPEPKPFAPITVMPEMASTPHYDMPPPMPQPPAHQPQRTTKDQTQRRPKRAHAPAAGQPCPRRRGLRLTPAIMGKGVILSEVLAPPLALRSNPKSLERL